MILRQPKIHVSLRIVAAGGIVLWLLASSCCSIEYLCSDYHHHAKADASEPVAHNDSDHSQEAEAAEHAPGEASHPHDSERPSRDSHPHDGGGDSCCSTLIATAQIATPFVIAKPVLQPLDFLCTVLPARDPMLAAPETKPLRQAKPSDWVLTPQVCLDAAYRSLAPPSLA